MNALNLFVTLLIVQMFWALSVSLIVPVMPNATSNQVVMFNSSSSIVNFSTLSNSVTSGVSSQTSLPIIETGALIFYSSSAILNLMVNFFTAIPQMVTLLLTAIFMFIPVDYTIQFTIKSLGFVIVTILYYMILFSYITGTRSAYSGGLG